MNGSPLKMVFTCSECICSARELSMPMLPQQQELQESGDFVFNAVGCWTYVQRWLIDQFKKKVRQKWWWEWAENMAGCQYRVARMESHTSGTGQLPVPTLVGKTWEKREDRRRSVAQTVMKSVKWTTSTHPCGVVRWRENIKTTQLHGFGKWRSKKYSYWLSCTHATLKIPTTVF